MHHCVPRWIPQVTDLWAEDNEEFQKWLSRLNPERRPQLQAVMMAEGKPRNLSQEVNRRLDPSGDYEKNVDSFRAINNPISRGFLRLLGVKTETLDQMRQLVEQADETTHGHVLAVKNLPALGWGVFGGQPANEYEEAGRLAASGSIKAADALLIEAWNSKDRMRVGLQRVKYLGVASDKWRDLFMRRWELLEKALQHHEAGRYDASIPIVLSHIDGITIDVTGSHSMSFYEKKAEHLIDDETLAGIPEGLLAVASLLSRHVKRTSLDGRLVRHGILHGRELGYDTLENSTKAFVALLALVEWAQPQMRAKIGIDEAEQQARWAGSDEIDADGRRRDRRGFAATKDDLEFIARAQQNEFKNTGAYSGDIEDLLFGGMGNDFLCAKDQIRVCVNTPKNEYWAYRAATSGFVFGIAGRDGDQVVWEYAAESNPNGGIDSDGWYHQAGPNPHVEWIGERGSFK